MAESACRVIELDEGSELEFIESNEYIFDQIGASVPLAPGDSQFDPSKLPSQPLAVSEKQKLLFVAHDEGFLVARTLDVIQAAKDIKEQGRCPSLREVCVVNVLIGKVHILSLSRDSEMVAACVGSDIHFFSVNSLLSEEQTPHYSCSLSESEYVKDMKWTIKNGKSFIVLSNNGKLYHSAVGGSLQHVFDNVDAVDWSAKQSQIALARKNVLSILSQDLKEKLSMSLCFDSWMDGASDDYTVKVDSIKWVRPDCIILGCLQVTTSGAEENYLVQAISVKEGKFADTSSDPIVSSSSEIFPGISDDIVPFGTGPYLFLSYLTQCELGIICNKKTVDQHINLIDWSNGDLNSEVAIIDFNRDKWAPRIPLQDNDDENLVVGLCIDRVSLYDKIRFQQGVDDPKELLPICVMFCLTLEGKVSMFHLASVSDTPVIQHDTLLSDGDISSETSDTRHDQLKVASQTDQPKLEGSISKIQSQEVSNSDQLQMEQSEEDPKRNDSTITTSPTLEKTFGDENSQKTYNLSHVSDRGFKESFTHISANNIGVESSIPTSENTFHDSYSRSSNKDFKKDTESCSMALGTFGMSFTNSFPKDSGGVSHFSSSSNSQANKDANIDHRTNGRAFDKDSAVQNSSFKDAQTSTYQSQPSPKIGLSGGSNFSPKIEALPSVRNSQLLFQQQNIPDSRFQSEMEKYGTRPPPGKPTSEASLSKGSINIREMTAQLDKLLKDIEESGGFVDFTTGQTNSAEALCHGLEALAGECNTWKSIMKERHEEIQDLLNKTVKVLARKTYAEGIIKQASDTHYWDLWDRQRLGSELEMKRRNIIKIHQELTNQLIQLEIHFNNLELNKFGQKDGAGVSHRGLQSRLGEPRHLQSINSLQNTIVSQLVVAEQLSQSLSEQMALLNVESPSPTQQNVKRDLFKTIGLPLDTASFSSPGNSSLRRHSVLSLSASAKDKRMQTTGTGYKNLEPETARRHRESLERSWVAFEPHKTTVKRTVPREGRKSEIQKALTIPRMQEKSPFSQLNERRTPSTLYPSRNRVVQDTLTVEESKSSKSRFKWVDNDTRISQTGSSVSPAKANLMPFSLPSIASKPLLGQSGAMLSGSLISENSDVRGSSSNDFKSTILADTKDGRTNLGTLYNTSSTISQPNVKETLFDRPTTQGIFTMSSNGKGAQSAQVSVTPEVPALSGKALQFDHGLNQSQSGTEVISFPDSSSTTSLFSSVSSVQAAPSLLTFSSFSKSSASSDASLSNPFLNPKSISEASKLTFPVSTSPSIFRSFSSTPLSDKSQVHVKPSNETSQSDRGADKQQQEELPPFKLTPLLKPKVEVTAESATSVSVPPTSNITPKLEDSSPKAATTKISEDGKPPFNIGGASVSPTSGFSLNLENAAVSEPKVDVQEEQKLNEQSSFSGLVKSQQEQPLSTINGSASTEKTEASAEASANAGYQEDEMEEEAPETNPSAEIASGSLSSFGFGSSTPANPNRNPFGGSLGNPSASPANSPFTVSSSGGELFRPASFSFSPAQPQQTPSQPAATSFSGFGSSSTPTGFGFAANQAPTGGGFGQPAPSGGGFGQPAQVGQGQQALGSVLGSFGQSRQIGIGQPANSFAPVSGFGSGFTGTQSAGGFSNAATKSGGFAALASNSGGFAGAATPTGASGFGGFAGAAGSGAGFGAAGGGGFGQQGSSFSAFGGTGAQSPAQLFTQMRK